MTYLITAFGVVSAVWCVLAVAEARAKLDTWDRIMQDAYEDSDVHVRHAD